ncbi:hypothetical protein C5N14_00125 [Micromonospora sp. MW-13]|uniref:hypothetical protein n=1 Tax=unclassified Micromonospora TaxID=2617518 RepID=UPI000E44D1DF|nr:MULTISPECIES: hypothetical protein [unclassified Micromonospora]MCX4469584.1 hypothetical protein [Micromonospora sp. NBC_01655]RGC70892.1 hypothetical protein C5N14_00125 [Micromonospora sp. MW-13]
MTRFPRPDARAGAVAASLAALALLVTLAWWRPRSILAVVLALLCVLLVMVAGVSLTELRQRRTEARERTGDGPAEWPTPGVTGLSGVDADTLEALDSRDALRAVQERRRNAGGVSDR